MATNKLLSLGGLGVSATTAIAGPGASLGTGVSGPAPYTSSLFWGLASNSKNLFQTFDLKCVDEIFSDLKGSKNSIKERASSEAKSLQLQNPTTPTSGDLKGCLNIYLKNYTDNNKGAVFAKIEMAVSKGDHGLILLNSITNTLSQGGWGFVYRALFLKNEGSKWQIKGGVQWQDSLFMTGEATTPTKIKLKLPENETTEEIHWASTICSLSKDCDEKLKSLTPKDLEQSYEWKTDSKTENTYQGMEIDCIDRCSYQESDFWWKSRDTALAPNSTISYKPSALFVNGHWSGAASGCCSQNDGSYKAWFNLFKDDKGEWKKASS